MTATQLHNRLENTYLIVSNDKSYTPKTHPSDLKATLRNEYGDGWKDIPIYELFFKPKKVTDVEKHLDYIKRKKVFKAASEVNANDDL